MPKWITLLAVLFSFCFVTSVGSVASTDKEVRRYLKLQSYVGIVPEHVQAAVTEYIPVGSSRNEVERALAARSIGTDSGSVCEESKDRGELTCELGIDHHVWELLRETYTIYFVFDSASALRKVSVRSRLSWL
jgi:hypothetical protein